MTTRGPFWIEREEVLRAIVCSGFGAAISNCSKKKTLSARRIALMQFEHTGGKEGTLDHESRVRQPVRAGASSGSIAVVHGLAKDT